MMFEFYIHVCFIIWCLNGNMLVILCMHFILIPEWFYMYIPAYVLSQAWLNKTVETKPNIILKFDTYWSSVCKYLSLFLTWWLLNHREICLVFSVSQSFRMSIACTGVSIATFYSTDDYYFSLSYGLWLSGGIKINFQICNILGAYNTLVRFNAILHKIRQWLTKHIYQISDKSHWRGTWHLFWKL